MFAIVYGTAASLCVIRGLKASDALLRARHWLSHDRPNVRIICSNGVAYEPDQFAASGRWIVNA